MAFAKWRSDLQSCCTKCKHKRKHLSNGLICTKKTTPWIIYIMDKSETEGVVNGVNNENKKWRFLRTISVPCRTKVAKLFGSKLGFWMNVVTNKYCVSYPFSSSMMSFSHVNCEEVKAMKMCRLINTRFILENYLSSIQSIVNALDPPQYMVY